MATPFMLEWHSNNNNHKRYRWLHNKNTTLHSKGQKSGISTVSMEMITA